MAFFLSISWSAASLALQDSCDEVGQLQGQKHLDFLAASLLGNHAGKVFKAHFLVAQNVAAAALPLVCRQAGSPGQIPHVAEIEATVYSRRHLAVDNLDYLQDNVFFLPHMLKRK